MVLDLFVFTFSTLAVVSGLFVSLISIALIVYSLYDLLILRNEMRDVEKLFWGVIILLFNVLGAIVYLLFVYTDNIGFMRDGRLGELERLSELKEKDAITEEEFKEMKKDLLEDKG